MQTNDTHVNQVNEADAMARDNTWLAAQVQESIDDPRPSIAHEEGMDEMDDDICCIACAMRINR